MLENNYRPSRAIPGGGPPAAVALAPVGEVVVRSVGVGREEGEGDAVLGVLVRGAVLSKTGPPSREWGEVAWTVGANRVQEADVSSLKWFVEHELTHDMTHKSQQNIKGQCRFEYHKVKAAENYSKDEILFSVLSISWEMKFGNEESILKLDECWALFQIHLLAAQHPW